MAEGGSPAIQDGQLRFSSRTYKDQINQFIKLCSKPIKILLSGKTGVGKSHLTNALIGEELAEEGKEFDPKTSEVTAYGFIKNNMSITVFDTPGLADATSSDEEYLRKIKEKGNDFDLILFCTEMNTTRFFTDDMETMKKLTSTFGVQLWNHAVVVLTFANMVFVSPTEKARGVTEKDFFNNRFLGLKKKIQEALIQIGVPEEAAIRVPFVPAGDSSEPRLADRDNWLTVFWFEAFKRINRDAKAAFVISNADRMEFSSDSFGTKEENQECAAINRSLQDSFKGDDIGKDVGDSGQNTKPHVEDGKQPNQPKENQVVSTASQHTIQLDDSHCKRIVEMVGDVTGPPSEKSSGPVYIRFLKLLFRIFKMVNENSLKNLTETAKNNESSKTNEKPTNKEKKIN